MPAHNGRSRWFLVEDWIFHHHIDQTSTAYNPYSGAVLALNEASAWVLRSLQSSSQSTESLELALAAEIGSLLDEELSAFLDATLTTLHEDARLIVLVADS
jgi:hypothetical protein